MYRWALENEKIAALIHEIQGDIESGNDVGEKLSELRQISIHYAEKGDLVYPVLKVRYEISGPSDVMWTVDDEIRDELAALDKISDYDEEWMNRLQTVLKRADEMIYKENNILYPICAVNFSREESVSYTHLDVYKRQLLHISEMSWGRVENPKKVFQV